MGEFETLSRKLDLINNQVEMIINATKKQESKGDIIVNEERFLKPERAADLLDTTRQTLSKQVEKGHLKVYRFGNETRYKHSELMQVPQLINR